MTTIDEDLVALVNKWSAERRDPADIAEALGRALGLFIITGPAPARLALQVLALGEFFTAMGRRDRAEQLQELFIEGSQGGRHGQRTH